MSFKEGRELAYALREATIRFLRSQRAVQKRVEAIAPKVLIYASTFTLLLLIGDLGFSSGGYQEYFQVAYAIYFWVILLSYLMQLIFQEAHRRNVYFAAGNLLLMAYVTVLILALAPFEVSRLSTFAIPQYSHVAIIILFVVEFSKKTLDLRELKINPALLFVLSFGLLIFTGTGLLMLPEATREHLNFTDALFTSTSAVCVTGLIVVDTSSHFTQFGQSIIMILMQVGGLGIMTFTSFFGFFFSGNSSFYNQFMLKDLLTTQKSDEVFKNLMKIILFTFGLEASGMLIILYLTDPSMFENRGHQIFFATFHSISAFCNAGFSTLKNGLHEEVVRFNYGLHTIIMLLLIVGGLGFPVVLNLYKAARSFLASVWQWLFRKKPFPGLPRLVSLHTQLVFRTTLILLVVGFIFIFLSEYNNTLKEHSLLGKIVTAAFSASTPRTAGFNTVDFSAMSFSTIMFVLLLMWIGASPGSTGGGIKTTTFAIGTLNFLSLAREKDRIEILQREISNQSIRRAFAIISLSLIVLGFSVFGISLCDPQLDLLHIAFECFSAYSTVGLTLGITDELSTPSRYIIIATMFTGRVGTLTMLIGILRKVRTLNYHYPREDIFMN